MSGDAAGLWERVERRASATPDALCAVDERDRALGFAAFRDAALRAAAGLHAAGVGRGGADGRVAWMLPTRLEALVLAAALARLGAVQIPVLPFYRERELGFVLAQTRATHLVVPGLWRGTDTAALARAAAGPDCALRVLVADPALPEADPAGLPPAPPSAGSDAAAPVRWIFYTSGTTADPKGALHTDAGLAAAARGMAGALGLAADDRVALVFPVTHVGGIVWLFAGLDAGCAHIVVEAFDPETSLDVLARHGVTLGTAGTVFHQAYLAAQRRRPGARLFPRVRAFPGGGAPKPPQLHHEVKRELGGAGVVSGWGLTECPIASMGSPSDPDAKLAETEGRPSPPEMQIRVTDDEGRPADEGELRVRGPQLCRGYLDSRLDAEAFDADGFFRTGDLGRLDPDGYVVITGRRKDVILRKGETISARELEDLLHGHPKVAEAAVVGVPDPEAGERACAVVVCAQPDEPLGFEEMTAFLREAGLALRKLPERLELLPALPRNAAGKVRKQALRERLARPGPT